MRAGELNKRLTFLEKKKPTSGNVHDAASYVDKKTVWCNWKDLNSVEVLKDDSLQGFYYANVKVRKTTIQPNWKIRKDGVLWDILGVPVEIETDVLQFKVQRAVQG